MAGAPTLLGALASKFASTLLVLIGFGIFSVILSPFMPNLTYIIAGLVVALIIIVIVANVISGRTHEACG